MRDEFNLAGSQEVDGIKVLQLETAAGAAIRVSATCTISPIAVVPSAV